MKCKEHLQEFLASNGVSFESEQHRLAYTAQEVAAAEHVSGRQVAKVVMVVADGSFAMLVLPASGRVDFDRLKTEIGANDVRLASEGELAPIFADCEVGAMPPFGNLYGIPVYLDRSLTGVPEITFQAGTHTETMRIHLTDYDRLVQPKVRDFATGLKVAHA